VGTEELRMTSCLVLEDRGIWRGLGISSIIFLAIAPSLLLLLLLFSDGSISDVGWEFLTPLSRSISVGFITAICSVVIGLPAGFIAALYEFPGRRVLLGLLAIPLIVPSFLWAIGFSTLRIHLGLSESSFLSGATGTIITFTCLAILLVTYFTFISARQLSYSQVEAARVMGGEKCLFRYGMGALFPSSMMAGILAGILTLSDPGPGQILGFRGVASEILVSFAALFDFKLAATQCGLLTGSILLLIFLLSLKLAPTIATGWLGKETQSSSPEKKRGISTIGTILFTSLFVFTVLLPFSGIVLPVMREFQWGRAWSEVMRTAENTLLYSFIGGLIATLLGFFLAICAGRDFKRRVLFVTLVLVLFCLPLSLSVLGWVHISSSAPAWFDPILRSRLTVCIALGLRFLPITTLIGMRSFGMTSLTWTYVGAISGLSLTRFLTRILAPILFFSFCLLVVIGSLLATADIGTVLLLRPPGEDSLPVQIFTIMANAPETLVSSVCTLYLVFNCAILMLLMVGVSKGKSA